MHLTAALGDYANLRAGVLESEDIHARGEHSCRWSVEHRVQVLFRVIEECSFSMAGGPKSTLSADFASTYDLGISVERRDVSEARLQLATAK